MSVILNKEKIQTGDVICQKYNRTTVECDVIVPDVPVFGLTAGLPCVLYRLVGSNGYVKGLERFGASAPYKVLDEKFGFTPAQVAEDIKAFLG